MIEICIGTEKNTALSRNYNTYKQYITLVEHKPEDYKAVNGWNSDRFMSWADNIGPSTREIVKNILESREYPVQTCRSCMGVMRFSKSYPVETVEKASCKALEKYLCS